MSAAGPKLDLRRVDGGVTLAVRLTPKSSRDEIVGTETFSDRVVLKARVRAVPEAGRANAALERLIAQWLKLPSSAVKIAQGGKSRTKQVLIEGEPAALMALIETRLVKLG